MNKAQKLINGNLLTPCWIGEEDDAIAVVAQNEEEALQKINEFHLNETGYALAEYTPADVKVGWFRLAKAEDKQEYPDVSWFISYKQATKYPVYYISL